jgi:hypothetical protein
MTDILALDLATTTGYARGKIGETPVCGSITFEGKGLTDAVFCAALNWLGDLVADNPPDLLIVEALLPPDAMRGSTSRQVRDRLCGLNAIARAVGHRRGVGEISEASVQQVRAHFIGARHLQRKAAKAAVVSRCKSLGWDVANDNEADACALWSYACALIDPKQALAVVPLFNPKLRVTSWP